MLKEYSYRYGDGEASFKIDQDLVIDELDIKYFPPVSDSAATILEAIRNPIDSKPLREIVKAGQKVAFICNDSTRVASSQLFMPVLLNELNSIGVKDEDMCIMFALGTHREMPQEEMAQEVGTEVASRVKMYNNEPYGEDTLYKYFGTTASGTPVWVHKRVAEADHIIATGSILYHFWCGYGGGRKAILPGASSYKTIRKHHELMMDSRSVIAKLEGNPAQAELMECVKLCPPSFMLNVVLNDKKEILRAFAGNYITAWRKGCHFVDEVYGCKVKARADLVIASCGGYPKDINVYQLQKTMDNAWPAVRDGGIVIVLGECREGSGSELYEKVMREFKTPERIEAELRSNFHVGAHKAYVVTRLMKRCKFILVSSISPDLARDLLFTPAKDMAEALEIAYKELGPKPSIILMPHGGMTVPLAD
ncbi:MAG: nickel-dependent lactate racemase [Negativicutes bacterium]